MVSFLAQTTSAPSDIGVYVQGVFQQMIGIDVMLAFRLLGIWIFIVWLVFALWVAIDASARYRKWQIAVLWFLFVLPFNVLGFIGYLFMRPAVSLEEQRWTKLESKYLMHELSSVNDCPTCGTLVPMSSNFCGVCGTQMNINCKKCESIQSIYTIYCSMCGERLGEEAPQVSVLKAVEPQAGLLARLSAVYYGGRSKMGEKFLQVKEKFKKKLPVAVETSVVEKPEKKDKRSKKHS
ncbi:zinc ribbon domain-containing protein [bacterium]|nr:zinc ribbon domain-containing protein [bacterium]